MNLTRPQVTACAEFQPPFYDEPDLVRISADGNAPRVCRPEVAHYPGASAREGVKEGAEGDA